MMTFTRLALCACTAAIVLLSACSTEILRTPIRIPVYQGPLRSTAEIGVFLPTHSILMYSVDGEKVSEFKRAEIPFGMAGWQIELLPGMHRLEFNYRQELPNVTTRSTAPAINMVNVEGGHIYALQAADLPNRGWGVDVVDVTEQEWARVAAKRTAGVTQSN